MRSILLSLLTALFVTACASTSEPEPAPPPPPPATRPAPPPPPPAPEPERSYEPLELPRTASQRPALALAGMAALAGAGAIRLLRRRQ